MDPYKLRGKSVVITGASGGIGQIAVQRFLEAGCYVAAQINTNKQSLASLEQGYPDHLYVSNCSVTDEEQVWDFFKDARQEFSTPSILVVSHGIFPAKDTSVLDMNISQCRETIDINLVGSVIFVQKFLRAYLERASADYPPPIIVFVGSTAGKYGEAGHADYAASKAGLQYGLTLSLKNEIVRLHPQGRVNTVAPGWVGTKMAEESMKNPDTKYKALGTTPMRKIATPDDVVSSIMFLSGDASSHITGLCLMVEGGMEGRVLNSRQEILGQ